MVMQARILRRRPVERSLEEDDAEALARESVDVVLRQFPRATRGIVQACRAKLTARVTEKLRR